MIKSDLKETQTNFLMIGKSKQIRFSDGDKIGVLCKDKVFRVYRREDRHIFRQFDAWMFNQQAIREAMDVGVKWVEVHAKDTKRIFRCSIADLMNFGITYKNPKGKGDYQIGLTLKEFEVIEPGRQT